MIVATVQSRIESDVVKNGRHIRQMIRRAHGMGARLVHFTEGALSGYAGSEITDWDAFEWAVAKREIREIAALAGKLGIWVVLGSAHRLTPADRPYNSLYVISDSGAIAGRYDKRLCSHTEMESWYAPGSGPVTIEVDGVRFGCALGIEVVFPHLFAEYERLGVDCMLASAYSRDPMHGVMSQAHAATNCVWLSLAVPAQCSRLLPSGSIGPDGGFISRCHTDGSADIVFARLDRSEFEVPLTKARPWRAAARDGAIYRTRN
jgi:predicted amidohydrolase